MFYLSVFIFMISLCIWSIWLFSNRKQPVEQYDKYQKIVNEISPLFLEFLTQEKEPDLEPKITIIVKTIFRPKCLLRLCQSIRRFYKTIPIIVVDDSYISIFPTDTLEYGNFVYSKLPFDSGVSVGRNHGIKIAKTPYVLIVDDDFVFTEDTKIELLFDFLENNPDYGLICAGYSDRGLFTGRFYRTEDGIEIEEVLDNPKDKNIVLEQLEKDIFRSERGQNFFLARTHVLREVPWDDNLKTNEHTEHFYRISQNRIPVAIHSKVFVFHDGGKECDQNQDFYSIFRGRNFNNFIFQKYKVQNFCGTKITEKQLRFFQTLFDFQRDMNDLKIPFELCCGTALGFQRDGGFIEWDTDMDVFVRRKDIPTNFADLSLVNFRIVRSFGTLDDGQEFTVEHVSTKEKIDIFILYDTSLYSWYASYDKNRQIRWKLPRYLSDTVFITDLSVKNSSKVAFNITPKPILVYLYGINWGTPRNYTYSEYISESMGYPVVNDFRIPVPTNDFVNTYFPNAVYVINLKSRPDKMEKVNSLLKSRGIRYERFEGILGDKSYGKLTKGEIGCALSHLALMKNALKKDLDWILIFEDDIHFNIKTTQKTFGKAFLEATCCGRNPEVIYFGHCFSKGKFLPVRFNDEIKIKLCPAFCTHAYALSRKFMEKIIKMYNPKDGKMPIDIFMNEMCGKDPKKSVCIFPLFNEPEKPDVYGEGIVLQYRNVKSDVMDRSSDKTGGKHR